MERFDIYDKDRQLTGRTAERGQALEADEYRLIVHVSLMNSQNQLLIQKRQPPKPAWPDSSEIKKDESELTGETNQKK